MDDHEYVRELLSAGLDGELDAFEADRLAAHLSGCDACRDHQVTLREVVRRSRVASARAVPDLSADLVRAMAQRMDGTRRSATRRVTQLRAGLSVAAAVQFLLAMPGLAGPSLHSGRDLAAFQVALACTYAIAASRPHIAGGLVPFLVVVAVAGMVVLVLEAFAGGAHPVTESGHLVPLAAAALALRLARTSDGDRGTWVAA